MMLRFSLMLAMVVVGALLTVPPAEAQSDRQLPDWTEMPKVGSQLPRVEAFDEHGQPFSTASLRGRYSVLVFGCLT